MNLLLLLLLLLLVLSMLVYMFLVEPFVRFVCQWKTMELIVYHLSWFTALPVPMSYGKWRIWAMFLGVFPVKVQSLKFPWREGKDSYREGISRSKESSHNFKVEW